MSDAINITIPAATQIGVLWGGTKWGFSLEVRSGNQHFADARVNVCVTTETHAREVLTDLRDRLNEALGVEVEA